MPTKPNNATSVADLVYDTLAQMQRWGVPFQVERITDSVLEIKFDDGTSNVQIRVSRVKF